MFSGARYTRAGPACAAVSPHVPRTLCSRAQFEELLICPIYGYASLDEYYREVSSGKDFEVSG